MKFFVKNKVFTLRGSSYVLDEQGNNAYEVKGKYFTFTNKKFIRDMQGNNLYMVRNKYWHFIRRSIYIYEYKDGKYEKMCRIFAPWFTKWKIKNYGDHNFDIEGGFLSAIGGILLKDGETQLGKYASSFDLASIFIRDAYVVDVFEPNYAAFLVSAAVGLDNIRDGNDRR
ncbi:MAG: LURP-one-related family protein [Clostridia bacterium]|nr:LURP-one-related family protein [Clostridia bacterium]